MTNHANPGLERLFSARRVAVIGASASRSDATGNQMIRNMLASRGDREIIPVSSSSGRVEGLATARSIEELPPVDVAIVAVGSKNVANVVEELEEAGCPLAVVVTVELDDADLARLAAVHRRGLMSVHGPNCMGVIDVSGGLSIWADEGNLAEVADGPIALISQSGSGAIFVVRSLDQVGFSRIISSGNEAGLTAADYIEWLSEDPATTTIGLVLESIPDGAHFAAAVRLAQLAGKRLVVLKVGRTPDGALATVAHTGALLSNDDAYVALFARLGLPLVRDYDELAASLQLLALTTPAHIASPSVGMITISGGQAALAADIAYRAGVATPSFSPDTVAALRALDPHSEAGNPLDAASGPGFTDDAFKTAIEVIGADPSVSVVMVVLDAQSTLSPVELGFEDEYFAEALAARCPVPLLIASSSSVSLHVRRVNQVGQAVPLMRGIANALAAVRAAATRPVLHEAVRPRDLPGHAEVEQLSDRLSAHDGPVAPGDAAEVLGRYGVTVAPSAVVTTLGDARTWADEHGFPVTVKVASKDIAHRSDVGGVVLNVRTQVELEDAWSTIHSNVLSARPGAKIDGLELQPYYDNWLEGFLGFVGDSRLGAALGVGMGGVLIELLDDAARAVAPIAHAEASDMILSTRLGRVMDGYRSLHPMTTTDQLADTLVRLSWFAHDFAGVIAEADLNPVLIQPGTGRVALVDILLITGNDRRVPSISPARTPEQA